MKSVKLVLSSVALFACMNASYAGFIMEEEKTATVQGGQGTDKAMSATTRKLVNLGIENTQSHNSLVQEGVPSVDPLPVKGFGRDVTVHDSLRQLVPLDWQVFTEGEVVLTSKTNWKGGRSWPAILGSVFQETGIKGVLNWTTKELVLFQVVAPKAVSPANASAPMVKKEATLTEAEWVLDPQKTLRENLEIWAKKDNWTLVWNATIADKVVDYRIDTKTVITGPFMGENGAMSKIVRSYSDSEYPLAVEFFKSNRIVEIRVAGYSTK